MTCMHAFVRRLHTHHKRYIKFGQSPYFHKVSIEANGLTMSKSSAFY